LIDKGLFFLLHNRDATASGWSGQATVNVLDALITTVGHLPEGWRGGTVDVVVNGRRATTITLPLEAQGSGP
jgi:hypothetical protein